MQETWRFSRLCGKDWRKFTLSKPFCPYRGSAFGNFVTCFHYGMDYYFTKNAQGDVIALLDEYGYVCRTYSYDAWGKLISITDEEFGGEVTSEYDPAILNPFRYRSYYCDNETGFYYLKSRYYDPAVCRFISADDVSNLGANRDLASLNLFAYCGNDPINRADDGGDFWHIVIGTAIGAFVGGITQAVSNVVSGKDWSNSLGVAMLTGAASGALAATGVGLVGSIAGNAAIAMAGNAANQVIDNHGFDNFDTKDMLIDGVIGGVADAVGGKGASYGNSKSAMKLGKQLTKRVVKNGEIKKAVSYYMKNMMIEGGRSIYKELGKSIGKSAFATSVTVVTKNILYKRQVI